MSMFFDTPLVGLGDFTPTNVKWHAKFPLLAVGGQEVRQAQASGAVHVFNDDANLLPDSSVLRVSFVSYVSWHPTQRYLAIGWQNGEIVVWNQGN